jgi:hypothetical protein
VIRHYERPDADPDTGDRACLVVITKRDGSRSGDGLREAHGALQDWARYESGGAQWPDASYAAITLWMRARDREGRAAVLGAVRSQQPITIDGAPASALMLTGPDNRWAALAHHADLTIIVAGRDLDPAALRLEPIADPNAQLLGPEPPDA